MNTKYSNIFSPIGIVLIIANLVFLNMWTSKIFGRIDLTETNMYTLSDVTKDVLRELEEPLTVKAYFTKDLPAPYNNISQFAEDHLAEMKAYGRGNFRYEFLDPGDEEQLKEEAENFRLEPVQVNEYKADKVQFKLAYMGMALIYEDRQEIIPVIQSLENIEYEILSKIKRVTSEQTPTIGFLQGHGEPTLRESMTALDTELRKLYDLKDVGLSNKSAIPDNISLLCVIGPKDDIPEADRFMIDQYIMKGGKVLFALNMVDTDISQMQANRSALRIDQWTENYGFKLQNQLVLDRKAPTLPFQTMTRYGRQITMVIYPLFPEIVNFNRDNMAMNSLRQVRLYFPNPIDTTLTDGNEELTLSPVLYTTATASIQAAPFDINPLTQRSMKSWDQGPYALGATVQGKFTSYWDGKDIPLNEDGEPISEDPIVPVSEDNRIVVIGDANFIQDQYLVPGLDNLTMALNLIDWLVQDERLITIRSRDVSSRPIAEISDAGRNTVKYANAIIPPLLVILYGLFRMRVRSMRRRNLEMTIKNSTGGSQNE